MPTKRQPWPDVVQDEYQELLEIVSRLRYLLRAGMEYELNGTVIDKGIPDLKRITRVIRTIQEKKSRFYSRKKWPEWVTQGLEESSLMMIDIKDNLAMYSGFQNGPYGNVNRPYLENSLMSVEKIYTWLTTKLTPSEQDNTDWKSYNVQ